jgi:NADH-quinone oxidoreductase subunit L
MNKHLLLLILLPFATGIIVFFIPKKAKGIKETISLLASLCNFLIAIKLFGKKIIFTTPWINNAIDFSLRLDHFSSFIILAAGVFAFLTITYSIAFMKGRNCLNQFYAYTLITISFANGAVLANNLLLMLFFWEGLLLVLFGMIIIGEKDAFKTAVKAFIINGVSDLCMMLGIILTGYLAGTLTISKINLTLNIPGSIAFIFFMIGAIAKAGSMPFHTWIPDAANKAPLPFMAFLPAALEKLLGIYLLTRISLNMFQLNTDSWISFILMAIGGATIILAVMMALIQKDYKRLLSYHAVSQVGYMILGIGTCTPAGIIGGLFHMINNAMYKSCLFMTGGSVEKQTGTTNIEMLGGLWQKMPVTFVCFIITAFSISGVPPFNGFFSKELIYEGALERGFLFYAVAVIGSFFTAASFLKLGHSVFLGKRSEQNNIVKESSFPIFFPMILIASGCVLFGIYNSLPLNKFIEPILGAERIEGHTFSGMPGNIKLTIISIVILLAALINHIFGVKMKGSPQKAVDHIHYAPFLHNTYSKAEASLFDPYNIGRKIAVKMSRILWIIDRKIDSFYDTHVTNVVTAFANNLKKSHNGNYSRYIMWSILGSLMIVIFLIKSM